MEGRKIVYTDWKSIRCPRFMENWEEILVRCYEGWIKRRERVQKVYILVSLLTDTYNEDKVFPHVSVWSRRGEFLGDHHEVEFLSTYYLDN